MPKKGKVYVLEVFFKEEEDLKTFVNNHFNDPMWNNLNVMTRPKDGFDSLHLRDYTKKVWVMKPKDKPSSMAHLWLKPIENMTIKEQQEKVLQEARDASN